MKLRLVAAAGLSAAMLLTACSDGGEETTAEETAAEQTSAEDTAAPSEGENTGEESGEEGGNAEQFQMPEGTSGSLVGTGASSMGNAQSAWATKFMSDHNGMQVTYNPEGSGAGVTAITDGTANFAGSDAAIELEENQAGNFGACASDSIVYNLPVYISPVAVIFNVEGVDSLNMTPEVIAKVFKGEITSWDDAAIADLNPDASLPAETINVVHRSDSSGTTENFADYLYEVAGDVWDAEPSKDWPYSGQGAEKTQGVQAAVADGSNTIGYVDASAAKDLSTVMVGEEGNFAEPSPEAAAAVVENSPIEEGREPHDLAISLDREAEGYPIVLVAYGVACQKYEDENVANMVKGYLAYITSEEGQQLAAEQAGSAPLSESLRTQVWESINSIS